MVFLPIKKREYPLLYEYVYYRNCVLALKRPHANIVKTEALPILSERFGIFEVLGAFAPSGRLRREDSIRWGRPELR